MAGIRLINQVSRCLAEKSAGQHRGALSCAWIISDALFYAPYRFWARRPATNQWYRRNDTAFFLFTSRSKYILSQRASLKLVTGFICSLLLAYVSNNVSNYYFLLKYHFNTSCATGKVAARRPCTPSIVVTKTISGLS